LYDRADQLTRLVIEHECRAQQTGAARAASVGAMTERTVGAVDVAAALDDCRIARLACRIRADAGAADTASSSGRRLLRARRV